MRPTISSLKARIEELEAENDVLRRNGDRLQQDYATAKENQQFHVREIDRIRADHNNERIQHQSIVNQLNRDAQYQAEILRLTRELLTIRTEQLAQVTGKPISVPASIPVPSPDELTIMVGSTPHQLNRKDIDSAAVRNSPTSPFIGAIKAIREKTGAGLKEAKDFCDIHFTHLRRN